jgi:D-allose transport system ATP-binding protein
VDQNITSLSGGNQQKVILGKWIASKPGIIIFDEPTKGIDVGTKSEIYKLLRSLASAKIGVIMVSSELPELLALCDRIIVFANGRISAEFPVAEATEEKLLKAATGSKEVTK